MFLIFFIFRVLRALTFESFCLGGGIGSLVHNNKLMLPMGAKFSFF
jgi:hypothetical protein